MSLRHLRVGFESYNYGGERNCYAPVSGVDHFKVRRVPLELLPVKWKSSLSRMYVPLLPASADVVHLWNRSSFGLNPWGASFSSHFPYINQEHLPRLHAWAERTVASDRCLFLCPISRHAETCLRDSLGPEIYAAVEDKVTIVPPHHPHMARSSPRLSLDDNGELRLLFVGATFFGKGGQAVLETVEDLGDELNLRLTVVSPIADSDYREVPPRSVDAAEIRSRVASNPRVDWVTRVPQAEVLRLVEAHHVGLLPTLADTFGYFVLENMGLATPTITTNIQALPEFTSEATGWLIDLPVDSGGFWIGRSSNASNRESKYVDAIEIIRVNLASILREIRDRPDSLTERGEKARDNSRRLFDPAARSQQMHDVYYQAVGG